MEHLPKRTNLVQETATTLKEWISAGILKELLPGELQLKARLGVGRDTLRLALKLLAHEGWITATNRGRQRRGQPRRASSSGQLADARLPVQVLLPYSTL